LNSAGYKNLPFYFSCEVAVRPKVELLDRALIERILGEAFQLLEDHGIRVGAPEVCELLRAAGARVENEVAHLPQLLARKALSSVPAGFWLYDRAGNRTVHYGGSDVHFDPGSSCVQIFDSETNDRRAAISSDLIRLVQLAEVLPQYAAQSTAVVCSDVPCEIGDLYRLFLVLWYSEKPVVTGAFSAEGLRPMLDLLAAERGGYAELSQKPRAVFDVCPSPPLNWSEFGALNLIRLARAGVPAEIIPMPLAGATAPVTLVGSVVQHAAECIAGITIHQLAQPAAPVVWGGAPAIFDMRTGTTPVGAIESIMLNLACAEVGRYLGLPTHAYLLGTDSKLIDAQSGLESGMAAVLGALSGINMISGAGMLDSLACHSLEKLVIDAEAIASAHRLAAGLKSTDSPLATATFAQVGIRGEFLKLNETRTLFRNEQYLPSAVIDRDSLRAWQDSSAPDTLMRAGRQACELLASYQRKSLAAEVESEVLSFMSVTCAKAGMPKLAGIDDHSLVAAPAETVHH
jgi:trimethylamine:corrinoid methyltransferase-like protein